MSALHLVTLSEDMQQEPIRKGFGRGLVEAGNRDVNVVALCADLTGSTLIADFAKTYPERFVQVGIAEQNLVTTGSGMAAQGKIPFVSSYAAFSPGRNWEQIRTTICLNDRPVKIVGSHAGLYTGPDGATHQILEDIALMRVLPNMVVVVPCDSIEAEKATLAIAKNGQPSYIRLARDKSPVLTTDKTPFELGKAQVFDPGNDITIVATGTMTYQAMAAAQMLYKDGIDAEVIHVATIKPLDNVTILQSARKTKAVITVEEAQAVGGLGGAITELLSEHCPVPVRRMGVADKFGQSGKPLELLEHYGLTAKHIAMVAHDMHDHKK